MKGISPTIAFGTKHWCIPMKELDTDKINRVLIIEDDTEVGHLLLNLVNREHEGTYVKTAQAAYDKLQQASYDLVLLDVMLPDANGFEFLRAVREYLSPDELPVIIISARQDAKSMVEGFNLGANDYIPKPIETSVLMARINTQLRLHELQAERNQTIAHLEKTEHLRTQLSRIASHDLKNPINNIILAEQLLREETLDNPRAQQLLNTVSASLEMMEELTEVFLDVVAIQMQNIKLRIERVAIVDVINNVLTQYELVAYEKDVSMNIGNKRGIIRADAGRMVQIVGNLVSNAIKYTPRGSEILIWSETNGDTLRLSVADQGIGIPKAERHLLFKEFSRLSTRPTDGEGSTGLGLWIVKHLVEMQDGHVGADFPNDDGTVFWVELPLAN